MWGPVPCARPSAKLDTENFHFGPVVASPDMIKNDCALWVDCQPDTSVLSDLDHLVLLLSDGGKAFVFAHIWQLRGFQSRKTETDDPMTQDAWSMGGIFSEPFRRWNANRRLLSGCFWLIPDADCVSSVFGPA